MAAINEEELWRDFFYTELTTGLRRGELCGLKWEDFDSETGTLKIRRTIRAGKGGALESGDTKTYAGTRKSFCRTVQCKSCGNGKNLR